MGPLIFPASSVPSCDVLSLLLGRQAKPLPPFASRAIEKGFIKSLQKGCSNRSFMLWIRMFQSLFAVYSRNAEDLLRAVKDLFAFSWTKIASLLSNYELIKWLTHLKSSKWCFSGVSWYSLPCYKMLIRLVRPLRKLRPHCAVSHPGQHSGVRVLFALVVFLFFPTCYILCMLRCFFCL